MRLPGLVLFDLDGTLVDSVPDISAALNSALRDLALPLADESEVRRWVGNGSYVLARRAITRDMHASADPAAVDTLHERFLLHYGQRPSEKTRVYDGVRDCLEFFIEQKVALGCVTNKPHAITEQVLTALGLQEWFSIVLGGDSLARRKPDPLPLQHAAQQLETPLDRVLMVGDSSADIDAANAAGVDSVVVTYGYNQGVDVSTLGAALVLDSLAQLPDCFFDSTGKKARA